METNALSSVDRTCTGVTSGIAPAASPMHIAARRNLPGRIRTAPVMDARFTGEVGSYRVQGMWRLDDQHLVHQDPKSTTFSTRQGPPTCSPPV